MQADLFESTGSPARRARRRDPATSHQAAERSEKFIASHEATIFGAICDAGERGGTYREIATKTGMEPVAVARRLGAMGKRGLICRRLSPAAEASGNYEQRGGCAVWRKA